MRDVGRVMSITGLATPSMAVATGAWGRVVLPGASEALDGLRRRGPAYWTSHGLALPNGPTTAFPRPYWGVEGK